MNSDKVKDNEVIETIENETIENEVNKNKNIKNIKIIIKEKKPKPISYYEKRVYDLLPNTDKVFIKKEIDLSYNYIKKLLVKVDLDYSYDYELFLISKLEFCITEKNYAEIKYIVNLLVRSYEGIYDSNYNYAINDGYIRRLIYDAQEKKDFNLCGSLLRPNLKLLDTSDDIALLLFHHYHLFASYDINFMKSLF